MVIRQSRIRNLDIHLPGLQEGSALVCAVRSLDRFPAELRRAGLEEPLAVGHTVTPAPACGPVSRVNADGRVIVHRDQPMEKAHQMIQWARIEWHGRDREEITDFRDRTYNRYPRTHLPPFAIEITVAQQPGGALLVTTPVITYTEKNRERLLHTINLLLEVFGECEILDADLDPVLRGDFKRLHWEILPQGRMPWPQVQMHLERVLTGRVKGGRAVTWKRISIVEQMGPDFRAAGRAGFAGYLVFGFTDIGLYVLESTRLGNATYIFSTEWERLSQLSKGEVLAGSLEEARIIHRADSWEHDLQAFIGSRRLNPAA